MMGSAWTCPGVYLLGPTRGETEDSRSLIQTEEDVLQNEQEDPTIRNKESTVGRHDKRGKRTPRMITRTPIRKGNRPTSQRSKKKDMRMIRDTPRRNKIILRESTRRPTSLPMNIVVRTISK